jgi:hypothetical protein
MSIQASITTIKNCINEKKLTEHFKSSFVEALQDLHHKAPEKHIDECIKYIEENPFFVDAIAVAILVNDGLVLREQVRSNIEDFEKELMEDFFVANSFDTPA